MQTTQEVTGVPGYLVELAEKLDCHFTFERVTTTVQDRLDRSSLMLIESKSPLNPDVATIGELVKELQAKLIDVTVVLNTTNPDHPVIHLIDTPLASKSDYVMDRKIDLQYSGIIGEITTHLEGTVAEIERPWMGSIPEDLFNDHVTEVKINAKQQRLREVLSRAVELDNYNRIIWISKTRQQDDDRWKTTIRFTGPRMSP